VEWLNEATLRHSPTHSVTPLNRRLVPGSNPGGPTRKHAALRPRRAPELGRAAQNHFEPVKRLSPSRSVQLVSGVGLEWAVVEDEPGVFACPLEGQCDHCLLIVGIGLLPDERVDETTGGFHLLKRTGEVERFSLRRLHRDPIASSFACVELDLRRGESGGTPPLRERPGFDAGREHTLARCAEGPLQVQRPPASQLGHQHGDDYHPRWSR
jgi:hypothetical protein